MTTTKANYRASEPEGSQPQNDQFRGRFSVRRKLDAVQRLMRGESLETLSRELGVTAATLSQWQETVVASALASLQSRPAADAKDDQIQALKAKVGDQAMEIEMLYNKVHHLEAKHPLVMRRWRR